MPVHKLKPSKLALWRGVFAASCLWFLMHEPFARIITKDSVFDVTPSFVPDYPEVAVRASGVSFSLLPATETSDTPRSEPTSQAEEIAPKTLEPHELKREQAVRDQTTFKKVAKDVARGVAKEVAVSEASSERVAQKQAPTKEPTREPTKEPVNPATARSEAASAVAARTPVAVSTPAFLEPPQAPHYPRSMRSRGLGGVVIVEVLIGAKGNQTGLEIAKSSGSPALDQSALSAVRKWRFKPHAVNGINVASRVHIPVRFAIN